jgi:hypothetical protein
MNKVFVLRDKECAQRMLDFIKATAGPQAAAGKPLSVEIGEYQQKRSSDQNRLYWSVLAEIAEAAEVDGKRFSREAWHEHFRSEYLPKQESPSGLVAMSTTQLTKQEFADYVTRIQAFASQTLGVEFSYA